MCSEMMCDNIICRNKSCAVQGLKTFSWGREMSNALRVEIRKFEDLSALTSGKESACTVFLAIQRFATTDLRGWVGVCLDMC